MVKDYIVDTNLMSYYIWGKILGVDKHTYRDKLTVICEKSLESRDRSYKIYDCVIKDGSRVVDKVRLAEGEVSSLSSTADSYKKFRDSYIIEFNKDTVEHFKRVMHKLRETCSSGNCYVPPEIPVAFEDGSIKDVFRLSVRNKFVFAPMDRKFNEKLIEFFDETKSKVLIDSDLLNKLDIRSRNYLINNLKRVVGREHIYEDTENKFYPVVKISDGKHTIVYDSKMKILKVDNKIVKINDEILNNNPALKQIINVLEQSPYDLNKVHEAIKALRYSKIENMKIESIKEFEPTKAYIDSYLVSVAHGDVVVLTADRGLARGFSPKVEPLEKEKIEVV